MLKNIQNEVGEYIREWERTNPKALEMFLLFMYSSGLASITFIVTFIIFGDPAASFGSAVTVWLLSFWFEIKESK